MTQFNIDLDLLADLMISYRKKGREHMYLDTLTGQPEILSEDLLTAVLQKDKTLLESLPEEERELDFVAERILSDEEGRYMALPEIEEITEFQWMKDFTEMVSPPDLYAELSKVLDISDMMREFNAVLAKHPEEQLLWFFQFNQKKMEEAELILNEYGITEGDQFSFCRPE